MPPGAYWPSPDPGSTGACHSVGLLVWVSLSAQPLRRPDPTKAQAVNSPQLWGGSICLHRHCAAGVQDAVFPRPVPLNHGGAGVPLHLPHQGNIHPGLAEGLQEKIPVLSHASRHIGLSPGPAQGHGLVQPFASGQPLPGQGVEGLPCPHKMRYLVDIINVQRAKAQHLCHFSHLSEEYKKRQPVAVFAMERVKGIEPSYPAWEADVLPMNYTRME